MAQLLVKFLTWARSLDVTADLSARFRGSVKNLDAAFSPFALPARILAQKKVPKIRT
jgi:hypothetical protein